MNYQVEIFDILSNYFTVFQAACIAILVTVIGYLYSGKWKKAFNSRYGAIAAALLTVGMLYAYIYPPVRIKRNMLSKAETDNKEVDNE